MAETRGRRRQRIRNEALQQERSPMREYERRGRIKPRLRKLGVVPDIRKQILPAPMLRKLRTTTLELLNPEIRHHRDIGGINATLVNGELQRRRLRDYVPGFILYSPPRDDFDRTTEGALVDAGYDIHVRHVRQLRSENVRRVVDVLWPA